MVPGREPYAHHRLRPECEGVVGWHGYRMQHTLAAELVWRTPLVVAIVLAQLGSPWLLERHGSPATVVDAT